MSSISVSRPAISTPAPGQNKSRRAARAFGVVAGLLAIAGLVLGGLALQDSLSGAHTGAANEVAHEDARDRDLQADDVADEGPRAARDARRRPAPEPSVEGRVWSASAAAAGAAGRREAAEANAACDPPYTIDPATGRKKYKMECLK